MSFLEDECYSRCVIAHSGHNGSCSNVKSGPFGQDLRCPILSKATVDRQFIMELPDCDGVKLLCAIMIMFYSR